MSAGRSSQLAACFSVDRTKYLMLSKWMPVRSAPQSGIGLRRNSFRPFSRRSSIHSGSFFRAEMSRTTSSDRPRRADSPAVSESAQPNLYRSRPSSSGCAVVVMLQSLQADWSSWSSCGCGQARARSHAWCRSRRHARWWPGAAPGYRAAWRTLRSRPRTTAGTRPRRARPGNGAGRAAPRRAVPRRRSPARGRWSPRRRNRPRTGPRRARLTLSSPADSITGRYRRSSSATWRRANSATASGPATSARKRSALVARSS